MTHLAEHDVGRAIARPRTARRRRAVPSVRCRDRRWPALAAALAALRATHRRSVRIVDADCGAGNVLLCAALYARALGFTAIEAHGIDGAAALVDRARAAATAVRDPAIGLSFATGDIAAALAAEAEFPADIILWHGGRDAPVARTVAAAGRLLIADASGPRGIAW